MRIKSGAKDGLHGIFHHLDRLLMWKEGLPFIPLYAEISPTNECNHNCFYCYARKNRNTGISLEPTLLKNIVYDLATSGVKSCEFQGGGEPILNKGLADAIIIGKENGMSECLVTNGSLLSKEFLSKTESSLSFLRISSIAPDRKLYAKLHGCADTEFNTVVNNIETAVEIKTKFSLDIIVVTTFILFDFNIHRVFETAKLAKNLGVNVFSVKPYVDITNPNTNSVPFHKLYKEEFNRTKELEDNDFKVYLNEWQLDMFMNKNVEWKFDKCYGVEFEIYISEEAKIYPCAYCRWLDKYCFGDLSKKSFKDIWLSENKLYILNEFYDNIDLSKCKNFCCKQRSINEYLYEMRNPPRHKDVI